MVDSEPAPAYTLGMTEWEIQGQYSTKLRAEQRLETLAINHPDMELKIEPSKAAHSLKPWVIFWRVKP
jgi:hypothetical protein